MTDRLSIMLSQLQQQQNGLFPQGQPGAALPQTRTFSGFKGPDGQVQPMGQYSQQAQGLLGGRNMRFLDPGMYTQGQGRGQTPAQPTPTLPQGWFGMPYFGGMGGMGGFGGML